MSDIANTDSIRPERRLRISESCGPAQPPWFRWKAPLGGTPEARSPELLERIIRRCLVATADRYRPNRQGRQETYCNIFVWDVTSALAAEIPHWVALSDLIVPADPDFSGNLAVETTANFLCGWLAGPGREYGWIPATAATALIYANEGRPAVAMLENQEGHGHMAMLRPGKAHPQKGIPIAQAGRVRFDDGFLNDGFGVATARVTYYVHC